MDDNKAAITIITHPGQSHRDEFLACCLLIAAGDMAGFAQSPIMAIERRDATETDLNDPNVIVLDQGRQHEPNKLNFDHHQLERDAAPTCSISLILPVLNISIEQARKIWKWLEFSELLDSKGPFETAERLGSNPDALFAGISPVETVLLEWFEKLSLLYNPDIVLKGELVGADLFELMKRIGKSQLDYLNKVTDRLEYLRSYAKVINFGEIRFLNAMCVDRDEEPTLALEMYANGLQDIAGTITQDDRGEGLSLFRRNDHPGVDFSTLEGKEGVVFAHKGGFIAKLEAGISPLPMISAAIAATESLAS